MQKTSLMLSNWVNIEDMPCRISFLGEGRAGLDKFGSVLCNYDGLMPIPLTPEILEKAGFKKEQNAYAECGYFYTIDYIHNPKPGEFIKTVRFVSQNGKNVEIVGLNWIKANSVHQLQNLYFILCGTPLPIEL